MNVSQLISNRIAQKTYVSPDVLVAEVILRFTEDNKSALVVSSDGYDVEGIIAERDIVRALANFGSQTFKLTVADVMTEEVVICHMSDSTTSVMQKMVFHQIGQLPVLNERERFMGIVTAHDVIAARLREMELAFPQNVMQFPAWRRIRNVRDLN